MKIRFPKTTTLALITASLPIAICMLIIGCSSKLNSYPSLVNQGILPVSPSNSYLGTNLFLGDEASKSDILYHFLASRGSPGAIELVEEGYNKPASMHLFYPRQGQVYIAELSASKKYYDWIVRGPFNMERSDFKKLVEVERAYYEASPIIVDGKVFHFAQIPTPVPTITPTSLPTPRPTVAIKKKTTLVKPIKSEHSDAKLTLDIVPTAKPVLSIPSGPGLNSDQQAIRVSKGLTELSQEGDIIHKVENSSETLEDIAKWYAGDSAQAKTIAEFNSIPTGSQLPKGAKLKIPKAIVKTEQAMR